MRNSVPTNCRATRTTLPMVLARSEFLGMPVPLTASDRPNCAETSGTRTMKARTAKGSAYRRLRLRRIGGVRGAGGPCDDAGRPCGGPRRGRVVYDEVAVTRLLI